MVLIRLLILTYDAETLLSDVDCIVVVAKRNSDMEIYQPELVPAAEHTR